MKRGLIRGAALLLVVGLTLSATTWGPAEFTCPICGTKNTFQVWASSGSYIYQWPSKYQLIFWPNTTSAVLYHCKHCHYTAFLYDFDKPPAAKLEDIRELLKTTKTRTNNDDYEKIPMSERLEVAEKIYALYGRDDEFWCRFYRIKGYHMQSEKKLAEADAARTKALELVNKMLDDKAREGEKKELLVIRAAMHHYLRDDQAALAELRSAETLEFNDPKLKPENNKNYNQYLTALIKDYIQAIEKHKSTDGED